MWPVCEIKMKVDLVLHLFPTLVGLSVKVLVLFLINFSAEAIVGKCRRVWHIDLDLVCCFTTLVMRLELGVSQDSVRSDSHDVDDK